VKLPEPPWFLAVCLSTEHQGGSSTKRTAGIDARGGAFDLYFRLGDERRVRIAVLEGTRFLVEWGVFHVSESGFSFRDFPGASKRITIVEGDPHHSFEVSPDVGALDEVIREMSED